MKIGIDISQLAYERTGVANVLGRLIEQLFEVDRENEYVLFFSSLRNKAQFADFNFSRFPNVHIKQFKFPPSFLTLLWNKLHIVPIENFIGDIDIFITSDWAEPPAKKAKKMTILYDLIVYKYPQETAENIVATQKSKLRWVKKETSKVLCISEATKRDAMEILGIEEKRLAVVYPGI